MFFGNLFNNSGKGGASKGKKQKSLRQRSLRIETLENRELLSVNPLLPHDEQTAGESFVAPDVAAEAATIPSEVLRVEAAEEIQTIVLPPVLTGTIWVEKPDSWSPKYDFSQVTTLEGCAIYIDADYEGTVDLSSVTELRGSVTFGYSRNFTSSNGNRQDCIIMPNVERIVCGGGAGGNPIYLYDSPGISYDNVKIIEGGGKIWTRGSINFTNLTEIKGGIEFFVERDYTLTFESLTKITGDTTVHIQSLPPTENIKFPVLRSISCNGFYLSSDYAWTSDSFPELRSIDVDILNETIKMTGTWAKLESIIGRGKITFEDCFFPKLHTLRGLLLGSYRHLNLDLIGPVSMPRLTTFGVNIINQYRYLTEGGPDAILYIPLIPCAYNYCDSYDFMGNFVHDCNGIYRKDSHHFTVIHKPRSPVQKPIPENAAQNYAVLFSGGGSPDGNHKRYYDAILDLYEDLIAKGIPSQNIYVIYADGNSSSVDRSDGENSDMSFVKANLFEANAANLQSVFNTLGGKMTGKDHLLFFTFDHGTGSKDPDIHNEETLVGYRGNISPADPFNYYITGSKLAEYVSQIKEGYVSAVFAQCYSGGLIAPVAAALEKNGVSYQIMSASDHYEVSYDDNFARAFINDFSSTVAFRFDEVKKKDLYAELGMEHPQYAGNASFSVFNLNGYGQQCVNPGGGSQSIGVGTSSIYSGDATEILTTDDVYLTYAVSNYNDSGAGIYAKYSWTDTPDEKVSLGTIAANSVVEKTVALGRQTAGVHTVMIELFDAATDEKFDTIFRTYKVLEESTDVGDRITDAEDIVFTGNYYTNTDSIGNGAQESKDVDIYKLSVTATDVGKTFVLEMTSTNDLDTSDIWGHIRLFDSAGTEIAHSTETTLIGREHQLLLFTPTVAGTYYVGLSSIVNTAYNPNMAGSGIAGYTGVYRFTIKKTATPKADLSVRYDVSWYQPVVGLSNQSDGYIQYQFSNTDDVYINYAFANYGETSASNIVNRITITGPGDYSASQEFTAAFLDVGELFTMPLDYNWGKLDAGTYTVKLELNVDGIAETTLDNNTFTTTFSVSAPLAIPVLGNVTATDNSTISVAWEAVENASGYVVQYATNPAFTTDVGTVRTYSQSATSTNIRGLSANTTYYVRVMATGTGNYSNSDYSASKSIATTVAASPTAPANFRSTVQTENSVTLSWDAQTGLSAYTLEYRTGSSSWITATAPATTATSATVHALAANTVYEFRLTATNASGSKSSSTTASTGVVATKPAVPTNFTATVVGDKVNLSWNSTTGADTYQIWRWSGTEWKTVARNITGTSFVDESPELGTGTYMIKAHNAVGFGDSATASTVNEKPATPTGFTAALSGNTVTLSWNAAAGADSYHIWRRDIINFEWITVAKNITGTSCIDEIFQLGTGEYMIKARNEAGYSNHATASATTATEKPAAPIGFAATVEDGKVNLSWNAASGANTYQVWRWSGTDWVTVARNISGTSCVDMQPELGSGTYIVKARNAVGYSDQATASTSTEKPKIPKNFTATEAGTAVNLSWSPAEGSDFYQVWRWDITRNDWVTVARNVTGTSCVDKSPELGSGVYIMKALNGNGYSDLTTASTFGKPAAPIVTATHQVGIGVVLTWGAVPEATGYRVWRRVDGQSWAEVSSISKGNITATSFTDTGVPMGTKVYYAVRAYVQSLFGDFEEVSVVTPVL